MQQFIGLLLATEMRPWTTVVLATNQGVVGSNPASRANNFRCKSTGCKRVSLHKRLAFFAFLRSLARTVPVQCLYADGLQ